MKDVYTTKSGVKIGLLYEPARKNQLSADMERLQSALLDESRVGPFVSVGRLADLACWLLAIAGLLGMFAIGSRVFM